MSNTKQNLAGVQKKDDFVCKDGHKYLHNNKTYDLREINDATAKALADDPICQFLAWKDESKRPKGQRGVFAPSAAKEQKNAAPPAKTEGK